MKTKLLLALAVSGLAFAGGVRADDATKANARAEVTYVHPEKFSDVKDSYLPTEKGQKAILDDLANYIVQRASYYIPAGQKLLVTVTDVDLAGDFEPVASPAGQDIRIVKDIYPPRIDLSYKIVDASGRVVRQGKHDLRDLSFNMKIDIRRDDPRMHEKSLIDDWMRSDFKGMKG